MTSSLPSFNLPSRGIRAGFPCLDAFLLAAALCGCGQPDPLGDIHQAARAGDAASVRALLANDPTLINGRDGEGMTPLHHAVLGGHESLALALLDLGADVSAKDVGLNTPLHHAANEGLPELVRVLVQAGADLEAREFRGRTPLFLAVNWGENLEVVQQLLAAGANVNDRTPRGEEILFSTLYYGMPAIIQVLLDAGARLPDDDESVTRAAYLAASNGFEDVFRLAVEEAAVRGLPWRESVPLHAAARGGAVSIGEELMTHGREVDRKNMYGITPLHIAAENGRADFIDLLVESGASLEETSVMGMTARHFALQNGHGDVAARLEALGASTDPAVFPLLEGPWLGQPEPGDSPERFALGIVSGHGFNSEHSPAVFSPDGSEVYWTTAFRGPISFSRLEDGRWTAPKPAPFISGFGDGEPIFSPDGLRLYFLSQRPLEAGDQGGKENIWFVEREGDGWSEPSPISSNVNQFNLHWLFSVSEEGTLYFYSLREGGYGSQDIYRSRMVDGVHQPPENLGPVINGEGVEVTPFIAPDESYLIFASSGGGEIQDGFRFFISYGDENSSWLPPIDLDQEVGSVSNPLCPVVTSDGRFMFFIGDGDVWWMDAGFIERLRPSR